MGKPKYIETPERMWELFSEYKLHCKSNHVEVEDYVGKDAFQVQRKRERPLTLEGFENYVADLGVIQDLGHYFANTDNAYDNYRTICSRIRRVIRQDQIEGGMAGIYNPSITQRLNNLVDKQESTVKVEQPLFGDDSNE